MQLCNPIVFPSAWGLFISRLYERQNITFYIKNKRAMSKSNKVTKWLFFKELSNIVMHNF